MDPAKILFPHEKLRKTQKNLMEDICRGIIEKKGLILNAPTGLGKTAAALAPALTYALENKKCVFFLTSRHTQHRIAVETIKKIEQKYDKKIATADFLGKKSMCIQPGINSIYSGEFNEFCRKQREDGVCRFFKETYEKGTLKPSFIAKKLLEELNSNGAHEVSEIISKCANENLCPYEISLMNAKEASIIICDYNYIFNPSIREIFLRKIGKEIENSIIIVDEGHNLPARIREIMSIKITNNTLSRAEKELSENNFFDALPHLVPFKNIMKYYSGKLMPGGEIIFEKSKIINEFGGLQEYMNAIEALKAAGEFIIEEKKTSSTLALSKFMEGWLGPEDAFIRIINKNEYTRAPLITISYNCLDPSLVSGEVFREAYSSIIMSGTLSPTFMYKDILGFKKDAIDKDYASPFPKENRINLIVPLTTTKYEERNETQFEQISKIIAAITNEVPGNSVVFFSSYLIKDSVHKYFLEESEKTIFNEQRGLSSSEKNELIDNFKEYRETGAVLLGVLGGSFGEGIDLPGDLLKAVVVVGLPFSIPDLKTKALIDFYQKKFAKGWEYGYIAPAFNKAIQGAGRCIRSKHDKGLIAFIDERYSWQKYRQWFPPDWDMKVSTNFCGGISDFFGEK